MKVNLLFGENSFYHVYNRGNNGDNIFYQEANYRYFLEKYDQYLSDYIETYAYCLLPNHFHLLLRVKPYEQFPVYKSDAIPQRDGIATQPELRVSEQFRRLFIAYAQAINIQESRKGSLFQKPFKRKEINDPSYFSRLVHYIHANPQKHGICDDFRLYPNSSYGKILIDRPSKLFKKEVLDWFGSKNHFVDFHEKENVISANEDWMIDE